MKKLMIAAVAATVTGAVFAANPIVYDVKMSLKTLGDKEIRCGEEICTICEQSSYTYPNYLENASRKVQGFIASCDDCTNTVQGANSVFIFWDATEKEWITPVTNKNFKTVKQALDLGYNKKDSTFGAAVYGKNFNKVAAQFVLKGKDLCGESTSSSAWNLMCYGLGSWDVNKKCIKSVSGNVVGTIPLHTGAMWVTGKSVCEVPNYCKGENVASTTTVPAYGTFTIKYNAASAKKELNAKLPAYTAYIVE